MKPFIISLSGINKINPPWYLYLVVVEWLAYLNDPESYAGGGIAATRITHTGQVEGNKPEKKVPWSKE